MVTLGVYLVGSGLTALTSGNGTGWVIFLYLTRFIAGHGHRRRVRGDQLGDRRADPGPLPRPGRHRGQRHLLGRRHPRHPRPSLLLHHVLPRSLGWRIGFLIGPVLGLVILFVRREPAGEPALADHARPGGRGRGGDPPASRSEVGASRPATLAPVDERKAIEIKPQPPDRLPDAWPRCCSGSYPQPVDPRRDPDDHPVVPLQRDLLHLHAGADQVLRRPAPRTRRATSSRSRSAT